MAGKVCCVRRRSREKNPKSYRKSTPYESDFQFVVLGLVQKIAVGGFVQPVEMLLPPNIVRIEKKHFMIYY